MNQKMLIIFHLLLMLSVGRCTGELMFETKTVGVGDNVTLTCARDKSEEQKTLFWIRLGSVKLPEFLGATFNFDYHGITKTPCITAEQGPGTFILHISKTKPSDTGLYYCFKVNQLNMEFVSGAFLRITGSEPDITAVVQLPLSDPVRPGDSVTLQCSVLSDSEKKTCPGDHSVSWFRAGSDESHPTLIYAQGHNSAECEESPEAHSAQKCVYTLSKDVSSSDTGTYYCAVATCGEILFGNGTKLDVEALHVWDLQKHSTVLFLLCVALATNLIVLTYLIYTIQKKSCVCCNAAAVLERNAATANGDQQSMQRDEDSLSYSAPTFTKRKAGKAQRRNVKIEEGETIYSDVRAL